MMHRLQLGLILCPMDSSAMSMNALRWANAMARARAAELRAFHVVVTAGASGRETLGFSDHDDYMVRLRDALAAVDSTNDRVGAAVRLGDPGQQILQFARSLHADLIVMGAAGAERPERPIGSVTATVVSRADCPVLIIPAGRGPIQMLRGCSHASYVLSISRRPPSVSFGKRYRWLERQVHTSHSYAS